MAGTAVRERPMDAAAAVDAPTRPPRLGHPAHRPGGDYRCETGFGQEGIDALLHNSGRVTDRSQSCLNAIEFALTQACPGLTYDSVPHI